ncbi:gamma-glutamylcyclotransferase family protein [Streptomyces sp. NPDC093225]|uniref:gamma-glutamylcyclotransferase family protein n=1 Tax=Streptomyces sp. NPDC093225 TaxID=3366034 RepID=UPI00382A48AD
MNRTELPFFVYGTLRPGEYNHDRYLAGRTAAEEPARLPGAVLYEGPGWPYAVEAAADDPAGPVVGALITPAEGLYGELLGVLDRLEDYYGPGRPQNVYDRLPRPAVRADGTTAQAWVYLAAQPLARRLRASGRLIASGDWLDR